MRGDAELRKRQQSGSKPPLAVTKGQHTIYHIWPTKPEHPPPHIDALVLIVVDNGREEGDQHPRIC